MIVSDRSKGIPFTHLESQILAIEDNRVHKARKVTLSCGAESRGCLGKGNLAGWSRNCPKGPPLHLRSIPRGGGYEGFDGKRAEFSCGPKNEIGFFVNYGDVRQLNEVDVVIFDQFARHE